MKILLIGHPNVGKSVFFNRLTGAKVFESNYPGTTVDFMKGWMRVEGEDVELIDVPGTFSLEPKDKEAEIHDDHAPECVCTLRCADRNYARPGSRADGLDIPDFGHRIPWLWIHPEQNRAG